MQHIDLTIQSSIVVEVKAPPFPCPYCPRQIRSTQRLNYPRAAVGKYVPVYRCLCGMIVAPIVVSHDAE